MYLLHFQTYRATNLFYFECCSRQFVILISIFFISFNRTLKLLSDIPFVVYDDKISTCYASSCILICNPGIMVFSDPPI